MLNTIGHRETEKALQLGLLYSVDEALHNNLIDEIAEPDVLIQKAEEQMQKWVKIPSRKLIWRGCYIMVLIFV
jgi:3,2-trans-enoyl-CoA isomerase